MFQRLVDDVKDSTRTTLQLSSLAVVIAIASLITIAFLCAAAFVAVLETYGLIQACLTGAAFFFVIAAVAFAAYAVRKKKAARRAADRPKPANELTAARGSSSAGN